MKITKTARAKMRLMSAAEKKKVLSSTRALLDAGLMGAKRAMMIIRNYS